jgi:ribosome biogenesis GTPase
MDQLLIVSSYLHPTIKWGLIDRYLVLAETEKIPSVIILNKSDLLRAEKDSDFYRQCVFMKELYTKIGYPVFDLQIQGDNPNLKDPQFKTIGDLLDGKITLLSGHSGVGKSSLVNLFDPEIVQPVEEDSNIFYKGRHTTTFASFIKLGSGGYVIDTPGIRSFTFDDRHARDLAYCFVEFVPFLGKCRYRECHHRDEPECAIREGVNQGVLSQQRYRSYLSILGGASGREGRVRDLNLEMESNWEGDGDGDP